MDRWGPLPATWRSTIRESGQGAILWFQLPAGLAWPGELGPGVETIQRNHRYAVVPPSTHPGGRKYQWVDPDNIVADGPPSPDELPMLPDAWIAGLTGWDLQGERPHAGLNGEEVNKWLRKYGAGKTRRAISAYFRRRQTRSAAADLSGVEKDNDGKSYVVLRNNHRTLAVYRIRTDGVLKRLRRWPPVLNEW